VRRLSEGWRALLSPGGRSAAAGRGAAAGEARRRVGQAGVGHGVGEARIRAAEGEKGTFPVRDKTKHFPPLANIDFVAYFSPLACLT